MKELLLEILRSKKRLLAAITLLLLLNIILFGINAYQKTALAGQQTTWTNIQARLGTGKGDNTQSYHQGKADLEKVRQMVPPRRQFPRVLSDIMESAAANSVVTGGITYKSQQVKDENLIVFTVSFPVTGSYAAVKSFLADLFDNDEMIVIDSVSLANSDLYQENVTMELHLNIYLRERT